VAKDNWFRNTDWNSAIEANFQRRLGCARDKSQYLRIQAFYLAESHPRVALDLLEQYFAGGDRFDAAQAYVDKARALVALGDVDAAISSYEAALERERQKPGYITRAYLTFPGLVAQVRAAHLYARALDVLDAHRELPAFPIDRYLAYGTRALLLDGLGRADEARAAALLAMAAAREVKSGFRYHQELGLVKDTCDEFGKRITSLAH
jgi:tetratricopeptide (TPR) repeat protein